MNNFKIISGNNFSQISDFIYCTVDKDRKLIFYPLNFDLLENGDIIYCKTDYITNLFNSLKGVKEKIKIITSESDYGITKNIFDLKPPCVEKWYAINVEYEHPDLIPIPLGLANEYCKITLKFDKIKQINNKKDKLLYINHRVNTNPKERNWLYTYFNTNNWCTVEHPNLLLNEYEQRLEQHKFMLCPRGNGIDTHRLWECLYAGVIPIVQNHITHKNLKNLPILFVDSFKEITEEFLLKNEKNLNYNLEQLDINWWKNFIKDNKC